MDPRHGELSPAMRNRGVEIFLENPLCIQIQESEDACLLLNNEEGNLSIRDLTCYSHAFIVTKQLELMKKMMMVCIELLSKHNWNFNLEFQLNFRSAR